MGEVTKKELEELKKELRKEFKDELDELKKEKTLKPKKTRKPSEFNLFVADKIRELRAKDPNMVNKDAFKEAVSLWNNTKSKKKK